MHENGHVYCIHSNILYRFWNGDLENVTSMTIPTELNLGLVQTNGMLVTTDGYLVTKQWSMNIEDLLYLRAASKPSTLNQLLKLVIALSIVLATIDYFRAKTFTTGRLVKIIITAALLGLTILVVPVSIALQKRLGDFRVADYLTNNVLWLNGGGGGEIKIIDPLTFEVIQDFKLAERCSYPRLAMTKVKNELSGETEDAIVVVGDENVYQLRWNIAAKQLYMLPQWTRRYRHRWAGSFPGTGPAIYDDTAYFTDNTFCGFLFGRSFNLYNRSILVTDASLMPRALSGQHPLTTLAAGPGHYPDIKGIPLTQEAPGFLFFSVVVSPIERDIIVWDAASRSVQARSLNSLALHWEAKLLNMDCLMVAADKGHIYVSDYSDGPMEVNDFAREANSQPDSDAQFKHLSKFFIVLNATTGAVIANVTIADEQQLTAMMIIAGANNDVFMGSTKGLIRISINTTQPQ